MISQEDAALTEAVQRQGAQKWSLIAKQVDGRQSKQCRERYVELLLYVVIRTQSGEGRGLGLIPTAVLFVCRWCNQLDPGVRKDQWTEAEDELLARLHNTHGNKWATLAGHLPGR